MTGRPPDANAVRRLLALYPAIATLDAALRDAVLAADAVHVEVDAGAALFDEGRPCRGLPLVLDGLVRVARGAASGRSLELYRVGPGDLCVVSLTCLFGQSALVAHGRAVAPTELVVLSPTGFAHWTAHEAFRRFVFGRLAERLAELMSLVEAVAFQRLDQRLAQSLLAGASPRRATHQALADELGTAREIVTRLLKRFEQSGWVALGRERIEVLDAAALHRLAGGA